MGTEVLERRFAAIGARLNVVGAPAGALRIDVGSDARGEFFDVRFAGSGRPVELEVVDVNRTDRHLLLLVRDGEEKSKFLCGHDERHWFVAGASGSSSRRSSTTHRPRSSFATSRSRGGAARHT